MAAMAPDRSKALADLCRRLGVASLYAFGSRAEEAKAWVEGRRARMDGGSSDLDLAVQPCERTWDVARKADTCTALEVAFGVPRADLVLLGEAPAFLAVEIIRGELLYCDDPVRQAREELFVLRRAGDLAPFHRARLEGLLDGSVRR